MTTQNIDEASPPQSMIANAVGRDEQPVRWSIPLALLACVLLAFFDKISIAALFTDKDFQQAMGLEFNPTMLGMLMSAFLLSYGVSSMLLSGIGDAFNPTKLLIGMMATWCVLMLMMGMVSSYSSMMVLRILLGIAEGPLFPLAFAIIRHSFPAKHQARATMMWLLGTPFGAAIGFPITMYILHNFGWRTTFFAMAALTIPVILFVIYGLRHVNIEPKKKQPEVKGVKAAPESRSAERRELFTSWQFWLICVFNISFLTYLWGMNGWLPSYLMEGKGIHLEKAGYLTSLPFIGMLAGEVLGAWISDRLDRRALSCFLSMLGAGVGLMMVLHLDSTVSIIGAMAFSMFMWGAGAPNIFALLGKATSSRVSATAGGIFNGLGNLAGALAPVLMGALIAVTGKMDSGLLFLVVMAFMGCLVLLPLVKRY